VRIPAEKGSGAAGSGTREGASSMSRVKPRRMLAWNFLRCSAQQKSSSANLRVSGISFPQ
jgi:hypothetical protein